MTAPPAPRGAGRRPRCPLEQPQAAARAFQEAVRGGPPSLVLSRKLARAQLAARDFTGAAVTLEDAAARWPEDAGVRELQAEVGRSLTRGPVSDRNASAAVPSTRNSR